jgi:hypothetical protein
VHALREQLDVPIELSLPGAVKHMSDIMGLPANAPDGKLIPLPVQVEALAEAINLAIPLQSAAASDKSDSDGEAECDPTARKNGPSAKKVVRQRKASHACQETLCELRPRTLYAYRFSWILLWTRGRKDI